jgi:nucleoporin GLE1
LSRWANLTAQLVADDNLKQFRFDCKKAVNTPVNSINATSSAHLRDKLDKLRRLFSAQDVEIVGGKVFNAGAVGSAHGVAFAMNYAAEKFVLQGEEVVSSKPELAFGMAGVIVSLWGEFPDFGSLFLGHLFLACPYLLPYNPVRKEGQSDEAHYRFVGYKYDDVGRVEEQDKFIKRMSGLARLYSAVCTSAVSNTQLNAAVDHPHGLGNAWRFLASALNLAPVPDVTATLIYDLLDVAGNQLFTDYGIMFKRLLLLLCQTYFPGIKEATLDGRMGPVSRLENFLRKAINSGTIEKPPRALNLGFL